MCDNSSDSADFDTDDESSFSVPGGIFRPHIPDLDNGIAGHLTNIRNFEKIGRRITGSRCSKPSPGTPVYCNLAVAFEHTGIYIGNGEIVHLTGDGDIETVGPEEFCARLEGRNPAFSIYFAQFCGKALGSRTIAGRAKSMVGGRRNYNLFFDNCHQFTCGCISGDFDNPCNLFRMVEMEIRVKLNPLFTWAEWNY